MFQKKKDEEAKVGRCKKCLRVLGKLLIGLIILAIVFPLLRGIIYGMMGWELPKNVEDDNGPVGMNDDLDDLNTTANYTDAFTQRREEYIREEQTKYEEMNKDFEYHYEEKEEDFIDPRDALDRDDL